MPVIFQKIIKREDLKNNPAAIYVFGDNEEGKGYGGQAAEMRDEDNAFGIPTKRKPMMTPDSFWSDNDFKRVKPIIDDLFSILYAYLDSNNVVVFPSDGIGTGMARLETKAPKIFNYINKSVRELVEYDKEYNEGFEIS